MNNKNIALGILVVIFVVSRYQTVPIIAQLYPYVFVGVIVIFMAMRMQLLHEMGQEILHTSTKARKGKRLSRSEMTWHFILKAMIYVAMPTLIVTIILLLVWWLATSI
jgi:hypothetical protein